MWECRVQRVKNLITQTFNHAKKKKVIMTLFIYLIELGLGLG